ncbi:MAG: tRNA (N(6)-L-threonylcarbamoyladenosine(37)-C(2))-methylthiotransferase MtaB [Deltaproteobacteria bacterium]|nr:tRNA (N(6)-L-threonylcarbamoyladenosine(37)-C(2))-methylthiotransferase MtaB [Deltaproteobacteria bacterium]
MGKSSKSFKIITLGCKVNQYESVYFNETFTGAGWHQARVDEPGDVVVVNTCVVTQKAAHQSRQAIRKAIRENPCGCVAAVGCYAQTAPGELAEIAGLGLIADNRMKMEVPGSLIKGRSSARMTVLLREYEPCTPFDSFEIRSFPGRARAYLKIQDGCQSFCTYCIVPFTRGPYRSLAPERVLHMLKVLSEQGFMEVVLTGIHLGMYGVDLGEGSDLVSLLRMVGREGLPLRIRLSSIEPNEIKPELIAMAASERWLCRHFHIPLQSGDGRILKMMRRKYDAPDFAALIESLHSAIPDVCIGVDVMSGFPGEDSGAHRNTLSLVRDLPLSYLHVFPFSPRPGTVAEKLKGRVDPGIIKERAAELRGIGRKKRDLFYRSCLGKEFQVIGEGRDPEAPGLMKGRSDNYLPVLYPPGQRGEGEPVQVILHGIQGGRLRGSVLN